MRGQFAPGIDLAQPPKLRTARDEFSIQAAVAYLRARSVRTSRDPANIRARSVRTWKRFIWSSSTITEASNSPTPPFVVLSSQRLHPSRDLPGHDSVPRLKGGLGNANHNADQILKPCYHPPPFRGWRGTKAGLGIRNSLDRRQGDLYKGTTPR